MLINRIGLHKQQTLIPKKPEQPLMFPVSLERLEFKRDYKET